MALHTSHSKRIAVLMTLVMSVAAPLAFSQPQAEKNPAPVNQVPATPPVTDGPGVLVLSVDSSSPAGTAGIVRGDILLSADGKDLEGAADLAAAVTAHKAGDTMSLKIKHGDADRTVSVTLADRNGVPYLGLAPLAAGGRMGGLRGFGGPGAGNNQLPTVQAGAYVADVVAGGPAEKAGLKAGDIIEAVNGVKLDPDKNDLSTLIAKQKIGDKVTLSVRSVEAAARDVSVVLDKNPQKPESPYLGVQYRVGINMPGYGMMERMPGFRFAPPQTQDDQNTLPQVSSGAVVTAVADGSPAATAGLKANDVITAIDGVSINSAKVVADTVAKHKPGDILELTVYRPADKKEMKITATLGQAPKVEGSTQTAPAAYLGITMGGGMMRGGRNALPVQPATPGQGAPKRLVPQQGSGI
jgi:S1-C subfamily serine protease